MAKRIGIRTKLIVAVLSITGVIYTVVCAVLLYHFYQQSYDSAMRMGRLAASQASLELSRPLNDALLATETLVEGIGPIDAPPYRETLRSLLRADSLLFRSHPEYHSAWVMMDYQYVNGGYQGRGGVAFYQLNRWRGDSLLMKRRVDTGKTVRSIDSLLLVRKNEGFAVAIDPFADPKRKNRYPSTITLCAPLLSMHGDPVGLLGTEILLSTCQRIARKHIPYRGTLPMLLSERQTIVIHPDTVHRGAELRTILPSSPDMSEALYNLSKGDSITHIFEDAEGVEQILFSVPMHIGEEGPPWTFCMLAPYPEVMASTYQSMWLFLSIAGVAFLVLFLLLINLSNRISGPIIVASTCLQELAKGRIDSAQRLEVSNQQDQVGEIAASTNLLLDGLRAKAAFAHAIGQGHLDARFEADTDDVLGQNLLALQRNLREAAEREVSQRLQEEQKAWTTRGEARFSELLRTPGDDVDAFIYRILHALVGYIEANLGAIFLLEQAEGEEPQLRLSASVAYHVRKHVQRTFALREGLVGRCAVEQARILMTDIPEDYVTISSGLGELKPTALLLVPMLTGGRCLGVVEVASFNVFEEYRIAFTEQVANTLASTLATVRSNHRTAQLLAEARDQAVLQQEQAEHLAKCEQDLADAIALANRRELQLDSLRDAVSSACGILTYDETGKIIDVNAGYLAMVHTTRDELLGRHITDGMPASDPLAHRFRSFWGEILNGETKRQVHTDFTWNGHDYHFVDTFSRLQGEDDGYPRIVRISYPRAAEGGDNSPKKRS